MTATSMLDASGVRVLDIHAKIWGVGATKQIFLVAHRLLESAESTVFMFGRFQILSYLENR